MQKFFFFFFAYQNFIFNLIFILKVVSSHFQILIRRNYFVEMNAIHNINHLKWKMFIIMIRNKCAR